MLFVSTSFIFIFIFGCAGSLLMHRVFSSCDERGLLLVVTSIDAEHGL